MTNKIYALLFGLLLSVFQQVIAQSPASVIVNCAQEQGLLFRAEKYNNVSGKNTGALTRNDDYAFMNSKGLHAKIMRVWFSEADVYNPTTNTYDFSTYTDYYNDVSQIYADEILLNFISSKMIMAWKYTPEQCKPIIKNILIYLKSTYPKIKYIECMNEPDDWGASFTASMVYPYYKIFYQAVNEVNTQLNPAIPLQLGGVALMSFKYSSAWLEKFLTDFAADTNPAKKLDFVSYHLYSYKKAPRETYSIRTTVDGWLSAKGLPLNIPAFITETGLFPGDDTSGTVEDDALRQAAGMAAYNFWLSMNPKNIPFQWVLRHANYERKDQMVTRPQSYSNRLTPYGNTLYMMSMMKLTKLSTVCANIDANGIGVYGLAASDTSGISVMCWNYQHTATVKYRTAVSISNLPEIFTNKSIRRKIYKIDQTTSNHYFNIHNCNLSVISDTIISNPGSSYNFVLPVMNENSLQMIVLEPVTISSAVINPKEVGNLKIYPTLLQKGYIQIEFLKKDVDNPTTIQILELSGKTVYSSIIHHEKNGITQIPLHLNHIPNGAYIVRVISGSEVEQSKLIINQ